MKCKAHRSRKQRTAVPCPTAWQNSGLTPTYKNAHLNIEALCGRQRKPWGAAFRKGTDYSFALTRHQQLLWQTLLRSSQQVFLLSPSEEARGGCQVQEVWFLHSTPAWELLGILQGISIPVAPEPRTCSSLWHLTKIVPTSLFLPTPAWKRCA